MKLKAAPLILAMTLFSGCFRPDPPSLSSTSAPSLVPAIKQAADDNDRTAIPELVDHLSDNDPAVRFAAIEALKKMTGQSFGYQYYDSESQRDPAIHRWRQWLHSQPVTRSVKP